MSPYQYQYQCYPTWRYHRTEPPRLIQSVDEELGEGWADTPAAFISDAALVVDEPAPDPVPLKRERKPKA